MTKVTDDRGAVIVVGGAGAIGQAVVQRYLERGTAVIVVDKNSHSLSREAPDQSGLLRQVLADVTQDEDIARVRSELKDLAKDVRHLVSLAGGASDAEFGRLVDMDVADIRQSIELNLTSHVLLIRAFMPLLERHSSVEDDEHLEDRSITLVSSINALRDYGLPAYSAAKAGMFGVVRAMASELGAEGIRINVVVPGTVLSGSGLTQPKDFDALCRGTVLGRLAVPDDIAAAVVALSHEIRATTGQFLVVDCGQTVATPEWRLRSDVAEESSKP